jgi:glutamine synthetase
VTEAFALTNPLAKLLDKPPEQFTRADFLEVITQKEIERITFHYTALDGKLKELRLPTANTRQAERILAEGERVDGSSLFKGLVDTALSDLYVVPVYRTAFLNPFHQGSLDFICRYLTPDGERASFALDNVLYRAASIFRERTALELHAMGELEFFLIYDPQVDIFPAAKQSAYQDSSPFVKTGAILDEMMHHLAQITGAVKYAHSEVGFVDSIRSDMDELKGKRAEQLEIEFLPTPVEDAGDHLVLGRWLIRNIAFRHGCVATFAPKLEEGIAGNGLHVHMELMRDRKNVMVRPDGALSDEARQLIGGLCHYADTLTAFGNPASSAYLRLVPNQEAPTRICWSNLNRTAMVRVPLGWRSVSNLVSKLNPQQPPDFQDPEGRQTVELRSPDGTAIIYLLLAGITMAAEWGLTHPESLKIADSLYVSGNIFRDRALLDRLPSLPTSCVEAGRRLDEKRAYYEREGVFPPSVIDYVIRLLQSANDRDMNARLADLPADDRLHETRRIMHGDLHRH